MSNSTYIYFDKIVCTKHVIESVNPFINEMNVLTRCTESMTNKQFYKNKQTCRYISNKFEIDKSKLKKNHLRFE